MQNSFSIDKDQPIYPPEYSDVERSPDYSTLSALTNGENQSADHKQTVTTPPRSIWSLLLTCIHITFWSVQSILSIILCVCAVLEIPQIRVDSTKIILVMNTILIIPCIILTLLVLLQLLVKQFFKPFAAASSLLLSSTTTTSSSSRSILTHRFQTVYAFFATLFLCVSAIGSIVVANEPQTGLAQFFPSLFILTWVLMCITTLSSFIKCCINDHKQPEDEDNDDYFDPSHQSV